LERGFRNGSLLCGMLGERLEFFIQEKPDATSGKDDKKSQQAPVFGRERGETQHKG
jgi:hypothetical protein